MGVGQFFTSKVDDAGPSRDWLKFVASRRAANKTKQWYSKERREDAIERQKAGQQRADPEDARRDPRQQFGLRPYAEGHQNGDDQEKREPEAKASAGPDCQHQIPQQRSAAPSGQVGFW